MVDSKGLIELTPWLPMLQSEGSHPVMEVLLAWHGRDNFATYRRQEGHYDEATAQGWRC